MTTQSQNVPAPNWYLDEGVPKTKEVGITWFKRTSQWRVRVSGKHVGTFSKFEDAVEARNVVDNTASDRTLSRLSVAKLSATEKTERKKKMRAVVARTWYEKNRDSEGYSQRVKELQKIHRSTEKYKSSSRRRFAQSPRLRMRRNLLNAVYCCLKGQAKGVSTRLKLTGFATVDAVLRHFQSELKPGMTMENYGKFWSIAHKIPKFWYSNSKEDIRRCNSAANLGCDYNRQSPDGELSNYQKGITLPSNAELLAQGISSFPLAWEDKVPSTAFVEAMMKAKANRDRVRM